MKINDELYTIAVLSLRSILAIYGKLPDEFLLLDEYMANEIDDTLWGKLNIDASSGKEPPFVLTPNKPELACACTFDPVTGEQWSVCSQHGAE